MAELQSQALNNITLSTYMSNTEQIGDFVARALAESVPEISGFGLSYESGAEKKITLSYGGRELASIDASDFVKDGMISDVSYDEGTHVLTITWNSDGDSKVTEINLSGLIDTYTAGEGLKLENGEFSLSAKIPENVSELENDSGYATSAYVDDSRDALSSGLTGWVENQGYLTEHQSLSSKRDLSDLVYTRTGAADAWDKWIVDSPLETFSRVILSPVETPAGELAWAWSDGNLGPAGSKYVRLAWNEDESKWTMTAGRSTITDISATVTGEWDDESLQFVDGGDRTWTAKRYAVADKLALDGEVRQWVENRGYLTEHQSLSDYYTKSETSSAAEIHTGILDVNAVATDALNQAVTATDAAEEAAGAAHDALEKIDAVSADLTSNYATTAYVNEGHGYLFSDPHFTVIQSPYGKTIGLSDVCFTDDYYNKFVLDDCLSAVRPYNSPSEVPLSAVVNAIWCLSKLQEWVTPGS